MEKLKAGGANRPRRVYGIDFSGAKDAGVKIWIASGGIARNTLEIGECFQARDLPGSGSERDRCLAALRDFISTRKDCAFGLDFPFGIPRSLAYSEDWEEFALSFSSLYPDADKFRQACWKTANNRELRRNTDGVNRTPFSPYNLRLYRQTYYGVRDILAPLVRDRLACVLPMQKRSEGKPWLIEVCPASTLKQVLDTYPQYKGNTNEKGSNRQRILRRIEETGKVSFQTEALRSKVLADQHGDALDSVIAAFATFRGVQDLPKPAIAKSSPCRVEGYIYV